MNSKERVRAAIAREPVDRIPLGFYSVDHDIIGKVLGRKTLVRDKIGVKVALWEGRRDEVAESLKKDTVEFYKKIDCADVIVLQKEAQLLPPKDYEPDPPREIAENKWEDRQGRIYQASPEINEIQCIHDPTLKKSFSVEDFPEDKPITVPAPEEFEAMDYVMEQLIDDRYLVTSSAGATAITRMGSFEDTMMVYALQPEIVHAANRQKVAMQNQLDEYWIRPHCDGVLISQDMGTTRGPLISPDMFRELCMPYLKQRVENVKKYLPQVVMHNCGNTIPLMDMLIECGINCYQSLQESSGMELTLLKEKFGGRLCFWGGVQLEVILTGTPDDVRKEVRRAMERGDSRGFILGPSHSIAMGTPYDNFMAFLDEFVKLRDRV